MEPANESSEEQRTTHSVEPEAAARRRTRKTARTRAGTPDMDEPSEDLLRIIHQFSSYFYTERGQMTTERQRMARNRAREARERDGLPEEVVRGQEFNKAFERSALVALGMLLQEQIRHDLTAPRTGEGDEGKGSA